MKTILLSAAAVAAIALSPALAQTSDHHKMMGPVTRAEMIQRVQQHFEKLDSDKDGVVTKAEMEAARGTMHERMKERMGRRMEEHGPAMFDRMDSNHDGSISRSEFDAAHAGMAKTMSGHMDKPMRMMGGRMAGHMFAKADTNNDGRVSLAEATAAAAAHFDEVDANRDGTLTPEEMQAMHRRGAAAH